MKTAEDILNEIDKIDELFLNGSITPDQEEQMRLSILTTWKEDVVNDIIQILWDEGNGFPCSREVAKKENCLQCKEIYKKIDDYLKSNP